MKTTYKYIAPSVIIMLLLIAACGTSKTSTEKINDIHKKSLINTGRYDFILYDTGSVRIADGKLDIKSTDNSRVTGEYSVDNQYVDQIPGNLNKTGEFDGQYNPVENKITFNMNPKIADANIFMNGTIYADSIIGTWNFSTMRGVKEQGIFKAFYRESIK